MNKMSETIPQERWPVSGETIVIGASGGADSTALVFLLHAINETEHRGWRLHLAHLNHQLRGIEADEDARFVERLARENHWGITIEQRSVKDLANQFGTSLEETARRERYAFFERVLRETGARVAAVAHQADDQIETVLHRLLRGTGLRGLSGIPAVRLLQSGGWLIRPLLNIRRADILIYMLENEIEFCHDHTNDGMDFTRNRIRNGLLPLLEGHYNAGVGEAMLRLAQQSRWAHEWIQEQTEQTYRDLRIDEPDLSESPRIVLDAKKLLKAPPILQTEVIRRAMAKLGTPEKHIGFDHVCRVIELIQKNTSGKQLELPDGLYVAYDRGQLTMHRSATTQLPGHAKQVGQ